MQAWSNPIHLGSMSPGASVAVQQGATAGAQIVTRGASTQNVVMAVPAIAGATIGTASALGAGWATLAIPIIGPVVAGVTIGLSLLFARKGPKQKRATTEIVNAVEPLLQENLQGYLAGPRTQSSQAQALANFDAGWAYVVEQCQIPEMGNPGRACVTDRQPGGQWNWFAYYRDPIANDPNVTADPIIPDSVTDALSPIATALGLDAPVGFFANPLALLVAGALVFFAVKEWR